MLPLYIEAVRQSLSLSRSLFDYFFFFFLPDYAKGALFCWLSRFELKTRLLYVTACALPLLLSPVHWYVAIRNGAESVCGGGAANGVGNWVPGLQQEHTQRVPCSVPRLLFLISITYANVRNSRKSINDIVYPCCLLEMGILNNDEGRPVGLCSALFCSVPNLHLHFTY